MGNLNDFKLIKNKSMKYFDYLNTDKEFPDTKKAQLGFYLFALECITNVKDIEELKEKVNDTEFTRIVFNMENDDLGIDAVDFDDKNHNINLFNFKFRENFKVQKGQSQNDTLVSMRFVNAIKNSNLDDLNPKTKQFTKDILERLESNEIWNIKLYMVSNDNLALPDNSQAIKDLEDIYDLEVVSYTLDDLSNFISSKPGPNEAILILDNESILSYEEGELSSDKSYLIKINIGELIRITSNSKDVRVQYHAENYDFIASSKLDFSVLFDNVRGYLGKTRFNTNILKTLRQEPSKFFMYNNGITMTAKNIDVSSINAGKKWKVVLNNFQVVNGGQTLRSIHDFKDSQFDEEILNKAHVLLRIFKTGNQEGLTNKIAEYTNSQNAISPSDLKSLDNIQMQIEQILKESNILYVRKVGDLGEEEINYEYRISMEKFGQLLYSKKGYPDRASNQKQRIFDSYYDEIFVRDFDLDESIKLVHDYFNFIDVYKSTKYQAFEQKIFYMIYLSEKDNNINKEIIDPMDNIVIIESALLRYREGESISESRKLIQKGFKDELDRVFAEMNGSLSSSH